MSSLIAAIGIFVFILLYFSFKLEEEHIVFKVVMIGLAVALCILLGKAAIDSTECNYIVKNSNTTGDSISYEYGHVCGDHPKITSITFFKYTMLFFRMFLIYVFAYIFWVVIGKKLMKDSALEKLYNKYLKPK